MSLKVLANKFFKTLCEFASVEKEEAFRLNSFKFLFFYHDDGVGCNETRRTATFNFL